ncbi:MAG: alpha-2-macroglobulin family protein [Thermoplasmata archaeon]
MYYNFPAPSVFRVSPEKYIYSAGEKVSLKLDFQLGKSFKNGYYTITHYGKTLLIGGLGASSSSPSSPSGNLNNQFEYNIAQNLSGALRITVMVYNEANQIFSGTATIFVKPKAGLDVEVKTEQKPDVVNVSIGVKKGNQPVQAAVGFRAVDRAVFQLTENLMGAEGLWYSLNAYTPDEGYLLYNYLYGTAQSSQVFNTSLIATSQAIARNTAVYNTLEEEIAQAKKKEDKAVETYWFFIILVLVGTVPVMFGYFTLYPKTRKTISGASIYPIIAVVIMLLSALVLASILVVYMRGYSKDAAHVPSTGIDSVEMPYATDNSIHVSADDPSIAKGAKIKLRQYFPEVWAWEPYLLTDSEGHASLSLKAPDSFTSYYLEATASTKDGYAGAGYANITFRGDFFIEPDIPASIVRNESFQLRVLAYNYLNTTLDATIYLKQSAWFIPESDSVQNIKIAANSTGSAVFRIRAKEIGDYNITVFATAGEYADGVVKVVHVIPDGFKNTTVYNGYLFANETENVLVYLDASRIANSENSFVKLYGGSDALVLDGAEGFIQFVTGCGEQSLSLLSTDILAYRLVKANPYTKPEKLYEYEQIVEKGLRHELQYLVESQSGLGKGIVWFPRDRDVHPWLTAWGLITFQDAINGGFTFNEEDITAMQNYLISLQEPDGSFEFPEWGLYEFTNPILRQKQLATTAYIIRALLYSGIQPNHPAVQKGSNYIFTNIESCYNDPYSLSLSILALRMRGYDTGELQNILLSLASEGPNNTLYWQSSCNMITDYSSRSLDRPVYASIETTAYAAMALKECGLLSSSRRAVDYIIANRNSFGCWRSTMDTIVGLQAIVLAGLDLSSNMTVNISAKLPGGQPVFIGSVNFTEISKGMTFLIDLRPFIKTYLSTNSGVNTGKRQEFIVILTATGEHKIAYQVVYEEWLPHNRYEYSSDGDIRLNVSFSSTQVPVGGAITVNLTLSYIGNQTMLRMVIIRFSIPVAFSFNQYEFMQLESERVIDMTEFFDNTCYIYIAHLSQNYTVSFNFTLRATSPGSGLVQNVYAEDMYNPALRTQIPPVQLRAIG